MLEVFLGAEIKLAGLGEECERLGKTPRHGGEMVVHFQAFPPYLLLEEGRENDCGSARLLKPPDIR